MPSTDGMAVALEVTSRAIVVRELEASLQQFGEFLLRTHMVTERAEPTN